MKRLPRLILVFWLAGLRALVGKIVFFVTVVKSGLAQVFIFLTCWLVAAKIISSRGLGCIDPSGRGGALRPGVARAAIAIIPIAPTLLVVLVSSLGFGGLGAMRRHGSCLLKAEQRGILVPGVIFDRFWGRAVAPGTASIYLTDP